MADLIFLQHNLPQKKKKKALIIACWNTAQRNRATYRPVEPFYRLDGLTTCRDFAKPLEDILQQEFKVLRTIRVAEHRSGVSEYFSWKESHF